jgi:hypothetical protein
MEVHNLNILMPWELMCEGGRIITQLEKLFRGWEFTYINSKGCFVRLRTSYKARYLSLTNNWCFDLCLGIEFYPRNLGKEITFLNIYGPYKNKLKYWEKNFR